MKQSDLKILIKKVQNECALEEPTKITYYWNDDGKLVFKIFFDSLIIPEELMVDEDNISKCFSEQNVYEFEDDFVIKELNREKGFVEIIPDDQKFKVINSYKDYNEDEKDVKNESIVHLAGGRISETFAKTKGFILREGGNPPQPGSINMVAIAFTLHALNDSNKNLFKEMIDSMAALHGAITEKGYVLKLFMDVPLDVEQLLGISTYPNLEDFMNANFTGTQWEDSTYLIRTDKAKEVVRAADANNSMLFTLDSDMLGALNECGLSAFKNTKVKAFTQIQNEINSKVIPKYKAANEAGKKSFESAQKQADTIIRGFLKTYQSGGQKHAADNFEKNTQWKDALKQFEKIKDQKPAAPEWSVMNFVGNAFTFGQYETPSKEFEGVIKESKKEIQKICTDMRSAFARGAAVNTLKDQFVNRLNDILNMGVKTAGASDVKGELWQKTDMSKGASAAGVDMTKDKTKEKSSDNLINGLFYLNVFTFFSQNAGPFKKIKGDILLLNPKANSAKPVEEKPKDKPKKDEH